jgi:hypothetical protein
MLDSSSAINFHIAPDASVWVTHNALIEAGVPDATAKTGAMDYRKADSKMWENRPDDRDRRRVWYRFDKLPELQRERMVRKHGDLIESAAIQTVKMAVIEKTEARDIDYFLTQRVRRDGATYTNKQATDLAAACAWLRWLDEANKNKIWKKGMPVKTGVTINQAVPFYDWVAQILRGVNLYGFAIKNGNYLYRKLTKWQEVGRECLISAKFGNANAEKITAADLDFAVVHYAQNKKSIPQVVELLTLTRGTTVTRQALEYRLDKPEVKQIWRPIREGQLAAQKDSWSFVKNAKSPFADALWLVDGTVIALFYRDENGQVKKSSMNAVFVRDHFSGKVIGLAFGETETSDLVKLAIRRAVMNAWKLPYSIRYDGGSANDSAKMKAVFDKVSAYHFKTMPYHQGGKANVERLVNEVETVLKSFDNFAGGNITRRGTEKDFNPDTVKKMLKSGAMPNRSEVMIQYWAAVEVVNNRIDSKSGKSAADKYRECTHEARRSASIEVLAAAFWDKRANSTRYEGGGLRIEVNGQRLEYWVGSPTVESYEFKQRYNGTSFNLRLDPENPQRIALYTSDDAFVAEACLKHEYSLLAGFETVENEQKHLREHLGNQKRFLDEGREKYNQAVERVEERGEPTKFDFLTLNKDALQRSESNAVEKLLEIATNTTKKRDKQQTTTQDKIEQKTVSHSEDENTDSFNIFNIYGQ